MSLSREQEFNLIDMLEALWRRKAVMLLFVIVAVLLAITLNSIVKPVYRASVSLLLSKPAYNIDFYRQGEPKIETTPLPLQSIEVLESIVKDGNLIQKVLNALQVKGAGYRELDPNDLQSMVSIRMDKDTGLMELKIDYRAPKAAAEIADVWSKYLIDQVEALNSQENLETGKFVAKELEQAKVNLSKVEDNLKKFETTSNLELYQKELSANINQVSNLGQKAVKAEVLATEIKNYIELLEKKTKEKGESNSAMTLANRIFLQDVQKKLLENDSFYSDIKFDEDWKPDYGPKQTSYYSNQVLQFDSMPQDFDQQIAALNMIREMLSNRKEYLNSYIPELKAQISQLKGKYSQENQQKTELKRITETAKSTYSILIQKEAEIKVAASSKLGQLRIIKAAYIPLKPYLPKKKMNILAALVVSLVLGGYAALSLEGKSR